MIFGGIQKPKNSFLVAVFQEMTMSRYQDLSCSGIVSSWLMLRKICGSTSLLFFIGSKMFSDKISKERRQNLHNHNNLDAVGFRIKAKRSFTSYSENSHLLSCTKTIWWRTKTNCLNRKFTPLKPIPYKVNWDKHILSPVILSSLLLYARQDLSCIPKMLP